MQKKVISILLLIATLLSTVITASAVSPTTDEIVDKAAEIIRSNEGTYGSVNKNDNGALSIGWIQWHGNRALNLLKDIVSKDETTAKKLLGDALYNEVKTSTDWSVRILTADEATKVSSLLVTDHGKNEQDKLAASNIRTYVEHGKKLGITSPSALVYFADMENQCGSGGASRVAKAALTLAGSGDISLAILHQAALADTAAGKYSSRRNKVYNYALLLGWEDIVSAEKYEIWTTTSTLNIRIGAGTSYHKIAQYSAGTSVIVYEQTTVDSAKWGRTSAGWICLDYCTFVRSVKPTVDAFKISFNANGGDLASKPKLVCNLTNINYGRSANSYAIFTPEYGATTNTNEHGAEVIVGSDGIAQNTPVYGIKNSAIPTGGFVLSAHGDVSIQLQASVKKGDYIVYNPSSKTVEVYSNRQDYLACNKLVAKGAFYGTLPEVSKEGYTFDGWYTSDNVLATKDTVVTASSPFTLTARWTPISTTVMFNSNLGENTPPAATVTASGVNIYRNADMLVVYDNGRGESTGANKWGSEAAVNSAGVVTDVWPASSTGTGDHTIPEGGFVLSGHGTMSDWILKNVTVGDRVTFDYSTLLVSVFKDGIVVTDSITAYYGAALGTLPSPTREGYVFAGWFTEDGTLITEETVSTFKESVILHAKWIQASTTLAKGDIDGNGRVNAIDMLQLKKELKWPGTTGYTNLDVDGNGKVNALDLVALGNILKKV